MDLADFWCTKLQNWTIYQRLVLIAKHLCVGFLLFVGPVHMTDMLVFIIKQFYIYRNWFCVTKTALKTIPYTAICDIQVLSESKKHS